MNELASAWLHFLLYAVAVGSDYSGAIYAIVSCMRLHSHMRVHTCVLSFDACIDLQLQAVEMPVCSLVLSVKHIQNSVKSS